MVKLSKKSDSFVAIALITGWLTAFLLIGVICSGIYTILIFSVPVLLLCAVCLIFEGRRVEIRDNGITVITLFCFKRTYTWNRKIFICTLKEKACQYNRYIIIPLNAKCSEISEPMMRTGWYMMHPLQAAIYRYSKEFEQELVEKCPAIDLVWVWSKFE